MKWTEKEINILKNQGKGKFDLDTLSIILNRSKNTIRSKIKRLGIKYNNYSIIQKECPNCKKLFSFAEHLKRKFCSSSCAASYNNKNRNVSEKTLEALKKYRESIKRIKEEKICIKCEKLFYANRKNQKYCSTKCSKSHVTEETKIKISNIFKEKCKNIVERERLKNIGRKGGFGKKGFTENNIRYESLFEKECFEYLDSLNINYIPHKNIPNSSKVSDLYFTDLDIYIELDGINREKRKHYLKENYDYWLNKLKIYKNNNLQYLIFYSFKDFKNYVDINWA